MKVLLTAINSKYIHSNPAVYALRSFAKDLPIEIKVAEYTINQQVQDILADIYEKQADLLAFSCYIWNIKYVETLLSDLQKVLPEVPVILGGPEVSYDPERMLSKYDNVKAVIIGEGEVTFREVLESYLNCQNDLQFIDERLKTVPGLCMRMGSGYFYTPVREILTMDELPFFYEEWGEDPDLGPFKNKILYYETSRGCPFRCSYCLSSVDKTLRARSLEKVYAELQFFLDHRVQQVKFIDRTFNCREDHALKIWQYILAHDNGVTNFHFEISADLMTEKELEVLSKMRPGLVQLEIGVQSTNPETIREIHRKMDLEKLRNAVERIHSFRNIHEHLDLIAGLPYEGYESFKKSFNELFSMRPDDLQLGFLKVLKGTFMAEQIEAYDLRYTNEPPYEVLSTRWISYAELRKLKKIEAMVELYYNSHQFEKTLQLLVPEFDSPFEFFLMLSAYYEEHGLFTNQPARVYRYQILLDFARAHTNLDELLVSELLTFDLYVRENLKSRPAFAKDLTVYRERIRKLPADKRNHVEVFHYSVQKEDPAEMKQPAGQEVFIMFDYGKVDPLSHNVSITIF